MKFLFSIRKGHKITGLFISFISVAIITTTAYGQTISRPTGISTSKNNFELEPVKDGVDSILASVNGEPISLTDVLYESRQEEARMYLAYSGKEIYQAIKDFRKKVLEDIINRKLIIADYKLKPFTIPPQYTESMLDELAINFGCSSRSELELKAKQSGTTLAELRQKAEDKIILQVMVNNYFYTHVNFTPKDLYDYYEKHKADFSTPEKIKLQLLMLRKDKKDFSKIRDEVANELKSHSKKAFQAMVKLYSDGPGAKNGGDLGWIESTRVRPEFTAALQTVKIGNIYGPITAEEGVYFLRVDGIAPATISAFEKISPELKSDIENRMKAVALKEYLKQLHEKAIIRYYF